MNKLLRLALIFLGIWLALPSARGWAQASGAAAGTIPWFTLRENVMMVQTGSKIKPLTKDVTLPNGIRVEHLTQSLLLTNGSRVRLQEGDLLSLNGEFIQKTPGTPVSAAVPAGLPVAAPAIRSAPPVPVPN